MILSLSSIFLFLFVALLLCFVFILSQSSFYALLCLTCFCVFILSVLLCFVFHIKKKKSEKYKNNVCFVYIGTYVPWMAIETKFSKLCIVCNLDEHLYTWLSKWALWLFFVMSKVKLSLVLNNYITLFDKKD